MKRRSKEFAQLQSEWYQKLRSQGFEDIEWFNPKTGIGQGSRYLKNGNSLSWSGLNTKYSLELHRHYQLAENFLTHGPFYANFRLKYYQSVALQRTFTHLNDYIDSINNISSDTPACEDKRASTTKEDSVACHDGVTNKDSTTDKADKADKAEEVKLVYTEAEGILWNMYCSGKTIRVISNKLRQLYQSNDLKKPNNAANQWKNSLPFSIYWVKDRLDKLKVDCLVFNRNNIEGYTACDAEKADEAAQALLPESNGPVGEDR